LANSLLGTCEASRFESNSNRPPDSIRFESDGPIRKFSNRIGRACPSHVQLPRRRAPSHVGYIMVFPYLATRPAAATSSASRKYGVLPRQATSHVGLWPAVWRRPPPSSAVARIVVSPVLTNIAQINLIGRPTIEITIVGPTADSIRDLIQIRILTPDSIRYSIRTQTADSQVPTHYLSKC